MSLSSGQKLGIYEILEPIGKGGMGEVYRARDTRLDRDVAVKVPEALSHEPERLARFEREAKLLAALNHPGIATLYGLEQSDGKPVLVMELVKGETLAEHIERGALSLEEAVALFGHIAEALGAAHAKGIVHRDLKPPNVKITPDGKIKILDFGLAKLAEADTDPSGEGGSQSPTLTKNTALGVILGTASYMSPEQARGKPVDKRTDIWAFGRCLFEALVGRKVFDGETVDDVLSKVLQREPEWSALPPSTPARLRRLIQRCLDKDPDRRVHDIADARLELEESLSAPAVPETRPSFGQRLPLLVAAVAVGALVSWLALGPAPASRDVKRFSINLPAGDEFIRGRNRRTFGCDLPRRKQGRLRGCSGRSGSALSAAHRRTVGGGHSWHRERADAVFSPRMAGPSDSRSIVANSKLCQPMEDRPLSWFLQVLHFLEEAGRARTRFYTPSGQRACRPSQHTAGFLELWLIQIRTWTSSIAGRTWYRRAREPCS